MKLDSPEPATPETAAAAPAAPAARLDEVRREFLGLEADLHVFARTVSGCRAWDHLRVEVFDRLVAELGLLGPKHAPVDRSARGHLRAWRSVARSVALRNPFAQRPAELLFVGHPRRRLEPDGTWWDAWSDPLVRGLERPALLVERPFHHRHLEPARTARIAHLDALALAAAALRTVQRAPFSEQDGRWFDHLALALREAFGVEVPVREMARARLAVRRAQLPPWRALLRRVRPRLVFLVVGYGNEIPIEACRTLGIPTVELQHGIISRQNLGYHFPLPGCQKQLFADHLFTFGEYWRTAASLPIPPERVHAVGFPYLEERRAALPDEPRGRRVVFLSQRSIGGELSAIAAEVARAASDWEVVYKLHPGERATWRHDYPRLLEAPLTVVEGDRPPLYRLLAGALVQVGVYSTALFEGLVFGLHTAVARLPGCEAAAGLVEGAPHAWWADGAGEITAALAALGDRPAEHDLARFFRPDALANARRAVEEILARPRR